MTAVNFAKNEKTSAGGSGFLDVMPAPAGVAQQENMTIVNFTKKTNVLTGGNVTRSTSGCKIEHFSREEMGVLFEYNLPHL